MAIVYTDTIEPRKPTQDITLGTSGETITLPGNDLRVNTVKDRGGNTLWTSDGSGNLSSVNAGLKGNLVLLDTNTFTGASSSAFTTLIDSTYDVYIFKFINIRAVTTDLGVNFFFQTSTDGGSSYGVTATTTYWGADHNENGTGGYLQYIPSGDLAQSTGYQRLTQALGNIADEATSGEIHLFAPSSTTYVKHFYTRSQGYGFGNTADDMYAAGYFNTTTAINAIDFKMGSGTFDGTIKMYGLL